MKFTKMHGLGNDYVYVNCFEENVVNPQSLSRMISDRHRGIGSDGLILIHPSDQADVRMEMYNADGSRAQMCGNGIRCVAKYAYEHGLSNSNPMRVETDAGVLSLDLFLIDGTVQRVRVDMGRPSFKPQDMPTSLTGERIVSQPFEVHGRQYKITCVSMGNPHVVIMVDDLDAVDLATEGSAIELHPAFPERTNVHFVQILADDQARMKAWERGSGATQACGTGACAVAVAGSINNELNRQSRVHLPGGSLDIDWAGNDHVFMTGAAVEVFDGVWEPSSSD